MLSFEDARQRLLGLARALPAERVAIDRARGRVLRERLSAPHDHPRFDLSTMDGFAVRALDGTNLPIVREESRAGGPLPPPLAPKHAMRVYTGAPMPEGADAVVIQEDVTVEGGSARFASAPRAGANVRPRGQDMRAGEIALEEGARLGPAQCALAASLDRAWLRVSRRPIVTILSTGDELRDPGTAGADPTAIPETNGVALAALTEHAGAIARVAPFVRDDEAATREAVREALRASDVVVTVGGASVGAHDHVRPALEAEGVAIDFWKVAMKPGKPLAVGTREGAIVLGVPGNPASAMITFALFGAPLLRALQNDRAPIRSRTATLEAPIAREPGRTEFYRATLEGSVVRVLLNQASGSIVTMARANALCVVPPEATRLDAGAEVEVLSFAELGL